MQKNPTLYFRNILTQIISFVVAQDILLVLAAGNLEEDETDPKEGGADSDRTTFWPEEVSSSDHRRVVASCGWQQNLSHFSRTAPFYAPGENVLAARPLGAEMSCPCHFSSSYQISSGSSQAAAVYTGLHAANKLSSTFFQING